MAIQIQGLGSGLDVDGIVTQLMQVERQPLTALDKKESDFKAQLSAYGTMQSALSSLQSAANTLASADKLRASRASVGDSTLVSASASASAAVGSYSVEVKQLAQAQKLKSASFATTGTAVGTGTLTFEFGSYSGGAFTLNPDLASKSVTIGAGQNSLAGVRDAINAANAGVQASIVNDGSGQRLVISGASTGAASALRITVADDDGVDGDASGLSRLAYDASTGGAMQLSQTVAAQDASVVIDGITVTRATNSVSDAVEGVTLNLSKAAPGAPTTLTVARDIDGAQSAINAFVAAYNSAAGTLKNLSAYDPDTKVAATLQGDSTLISIQSRLRSTLGAAVQFAGGYASLSQLGIAVQRDGTLLADATKLRAALADPSKDAATAFAAVGTPSDSLVTFAGASSSALPGDYALQVTRVATRGNASGSQAAALTITAGVNDALTLKVNGVAQTVTLAAGTYTASSLAAMLQSRIDGVDAAESGGVLTLTSKTWGSSSSVLVTGGSAAADLFGVAGSTDGVDAAGSIGGIAAVGSGRNLTAQGLTLTVDGTTTGARGSVRFSRGVADQISTLIDGMLNSTLEARTAGINSSIKAIGDQRDAMNTRLDAIEQRYRAQFAALDQMMSSMNNTSKYLEQQLANLPKAGG